MEAPYSLCCGKERRVDMAKKKKFPVFWVCFAVFIAVMAVFWVVIIANVKKSLVIYENSQPEYTVEKYVERFRDGSILDSLDFAQSTSRFEDAGIYRTRYVDGLEGKAITYEKVQTSYDAKHPVYNVYADDSLIAEITLKETASKPLMFILTQQSWDVDSVKAVYGTGDKGVTITAPDTYSVFINGVKLDSRELTGNITQIEELKYAAEYVSVPQLVEYKAEGLLNEPEVTVYNNQGELVMYTPDENGNITIDTFTTSPIDSGLSAAVLQNAKNYSNYFSKDIDGCSNSVAPIAYMFPADSYYLELAENYRKNDMWMYSAHETPVFTNEMVSNYIVYTPELFSVEVYFEKNMVLKLNGENRQDITNSRYYYANIDGNWVIVDMQSVTG